MSDEDFTIKPKLPFNRGQLRSTMTRLLGRLLRIRGVWIAGAVLLAAYIVPSCTTV